MIYKTIAKPQKALASFPTVRPAGRQAVFSSCAIIILVLLSSLFLGCKNTSDAQSAKLTPYSSFRDIPGVDEDDIKAIDELQRKYNSIVFTNDFTTEAFYDRNGEIQGFMPLFCDWMTEMFGIRFQPAIADFGNLAAGLENHTIGFTGALAATEERRQSGYIMTNAIAERAVKLMRIKDSVPLFEIAAIRPLRYAFIEGTVTIDSVSQHAIEEFVVVLAKNYQEVYRLLKSGEADAYLGESVGEAALSNYGDVVTYAYLPLIFNQVSLTTRNPELEPIISVVQKALDNGAIRHLTELYNAGETEYYKNKLYAQLGKEEINYINNNPKILFAAEYDNYPVSFYNAREKQWQGIVFDVLEEIEKITALSFEVVNPPGTEWTDILKMLENGEARMITELIRSPEREGRFLWPDKPHVIDYYALLSRSDYPDVKLNEVKYGKVALVKDTGHEAMFQRWFPDHMNIVVFTAWDDAYDALSRGKADLLMSGVNQLLSLTNFRELAGFKANIVFNQPLQSALGFHVDQVILRDIVEKSLHIIDTESISEQWARKTYDYRAKLAESQRPWLIGTATLSLFIALLVVVLFAIKQNERKRLAALVHERTAELEQSQNLTAMLNKMSILFLSQDNKTYEEKLSSGMELIAGIINLGRISVWRNIGTPDGILTSQIYRWDKNSGGMTPPTPELINMPLIKTYPDWKKVLTGEIVINGPVRLMSTPPPLFKHFSVKSAFVVPLLINNEESWGFVLFEDRQNERHFEDNIIDELRSAAVLLVNTIIMNEKEREIRDAVEKAEKAGKIADEANKAKSDFLSHMSHEIRTPLNAVIGMLNIGINTDDVDKKNYCFERADNASKHLLGIINNILDISKIEANKLELSYSEIDFEVMLMSITDAISFRAEEKKHDLVFSINNNVPAFIESDELRLSQVIINLLSNAIKFTPEKGTVMLNIEQTAADGDEVTLRVEVVDTGIGISKEQQERVFTVFNQADSSITKTYGGTGLGLAISKQIVELMGGSIWVESELGKGSKFIFTANVKKLEHKPQTRLLVNIKAEDMRILAVDDSLEIREYFIHIMEALKLSCDAAGSGAEALDMIKNTGEKPYNIFFVDWQMPDIDGIELTKRIKAITSENSIVIMISAFDWNIIEKEAVAAGVKHFVSKPLFPSAIINAINICISTDMTSYGTLKMTKHRRDFKNRALLIAEDVEINREIINAILEETGVSIEYAENGKTAVSMFRENPEKYSLILMDVNMPEMNGYEATRQIRAFDLARAKDIPIIAMTANVFKEDVEKCIEAGMNDHIGKPINTSALLELLEKYLKQAPKTPGNAGGSPASS